MIPKTLKEFKKVRTINRPIAEAGKKAVDKRIQHITKTAKIQYGQPQLTDARKKAIGKYKDVAQRIDKIPLRKDKSSLPNRRAKIENNIIYSRKQPSGVMQGYRPPVVSKPQAKALKKLGSKIKTENNYKRPTDSKSKLPGRGTPERANLAKQKRDALNAKKLRRFGNQTDVRMYRNKKGTALGRPEKLKSLLNRRKANKNLYQGLEGL